LKPLIENCHWIVEGHGEAGVDTVGSRDKMAKDIFYKET
jgi:hypothetical protein